ncbi:hypothetical protein Syun_029677 [Stephania yunnanensis]|uniref:Uncharacterized protein n=1 Tax=Stephania yunnanensis TaxID=152371 RepID=A0AAP0HG87_9MAGN
MLSERRKSGLRGMSSLVPSAWRPVLEDPSNLQIFFDYYAIAKPPISKEDRVKPSPTPDSWKLNEIFATDIVIGTYLALITVLFYWAVTKTNFFEAKHQIRRHQELTQTTPDQPLDDEAVYYKVAGDRPKGCVYSVR